MTTAKQIIHTDDAPKAPAAYSQAVKAAGLVFVSGQGPFDPATGEVAGETIQEQTRQCLRNVEAILRAAGSSLEQVVSATFILAHERDYAGFSEEWLRWFPAGDFVLNARRGLSTRSRHGNLVANSSEQGWNERRGRMVDDAHAGSGCGEIIDDPGEP
ncbi:MAG: RidA family protein [Thermomicrobiales bacterium]